MNASSMQLQDRFFLDEVKVINDFTTLQLNKILLNPYVTQVLFIKLIIKSKLFETNYCLQKQTSSTCWFLNFCGLSKFWKQTFFKC